MKLACMSAFFVGHVFGFIFIFLAAKQTPGWTAAEVAGLIWCASSCAWCMTALK